MHRRDLSTIKRVTAGLVAVTLLLSFAGAGLAQVIVLPPPPDGVGIDPPGYYFWANPTTRAGMGANSNTTLGSWFFGTTNGNPYTTKDDDCRLVLQSEAYLYLADTNEEVQVGDAAQTVEFPAVKPDLRSAGFIWKNDDLENPVSVEFRMHLVRDVVKWEFTIKNLSPYSHRFGFRVLENISWPPNEPKRAANGDSALAPQKVVVEAPYKFPGGTSTNVTSEYVGGAVPDKWYINYPENPSIDDGFRSWWKGSQPLRDTVSRPSRLVFANWDKLAGYTWPDIQDALLPENAGQQWPLTLGDALSFDTGVGLYYPILALGPNSSRKITGEVQMNWAQFNTIGHYSVSAYGPDWLGYRDGDDPTTAAVENGYYAPNYAEISTWITNNSLIDEPNVSVSIDPGEGLALADGQTLSYNNLSLRGMQERLVRKNDADEFTWRLVPTGTAFGRIPVRITASYSLAGSTSTVVYVNVPALPKQTLQPATHLIGFPFQLDNDPNDGVNTADARVALGLGPNVQLVWYDPVAGGYKYAASDGVTLEPGRAYWLKVPNTTTLSLANAAPVSQRDAFRVTLNRGWNAISTPYQFTTEWGSIHVIWNNEEYTFADAISRGIIRPEIWAWDPVKNVYTPPVNPAPLVATTTPMKPYQGFWLYAGESCRLVYEPDTTLAVMNPKSTGARATRVAGTPENWQANLLVQAGDAKDTLNTFGVAAASPDSGADGNIMEPPMSPNGLSAYFARRDGTRAAGNYAQYLLAPGGAKTWSFEVNCTRADTTVALRWPDLANLPAGMPVVLTDETTGQQVSLRTTTGYRYNSGQGGIRRFTLQAGGQQERLRFSQVHMTTGKAVASGAAVSYALTQPAAVTIEWRTPTGRLVRTLSPGRSSGDLTTVIWDGCDTQGRRLPGGLYLCTLTAAAADGQQTRATLTVPVK